MKAAPFDDAVDAAAVRDFQVHLKAILDTNKFAGDRLSAKFSADAQVTKEMLSTRSKNLESRMAIYASMRINNQRNWYAAKAGTNKKAGFRWVVFCVTVYVFAICSSLERAQNPEMTWLPTELLIAIASSVVGWIQIKKFNELAASYILTAHEIGILHGKFSQISDEKEFAEFVNEAEQAFSREHTQWVARIS